MTEKPDLSQPSLAGLAWLLRHQEEWPQSFTWDFRRICTRREYERDEPFLGHPPECNVLGDAIGLACVMWPEAMKSRALRLTYFEKTSSEDEDYIFCDTYGLSYEEVTPAMVADRIDAWLAEHGGTRA